MTRKISAPALFLLFCLLAGSSALGLEQGARGQINQDITRPDHWRRIVTRSSFPLGEKMEIDNLGDQPLYQVSFGAYPSMDGSTIALPMVTEFARQHLTLGEEDLMGFVFLSTTHKAYEHLIGREANGSPLIPSWFASMDPTHPVDLIVATEPSRDELDLAEQRGVTLIKKPVCHDAFVLITHADNPVTSLTAEQIQRIYTGQITRWSQVGGLDEPIAAYQRELNSGSQTAMENLVMQGLPFDGAKPNHVISGMVDLVKRVGDYENGRSSIGYTYRYYIDTLYKDEGIKTLAIDGVAPTDENIRSGAYPFSTYYYGVIRAGEEQWAGGLFLDWMLSEEGQRCIQQAGYISMAALE